jgi:hypothetical protein
VTLPPSFTKLRSGECNHKYSLKSSMLRGLQMTNVSMVTATLLAANSHCAGQ